MVPATQSAANRHRTELDAAIDVTATARRRALLQYIQHRDSDTVTFDEILDFLTGRSAENTNQRQVEVGLYHNDLPKLAVEIFINWDEDEGIISRGSNWDVVTPFLNAVQTSRANSQRISFE